MQRQAIFWLVALCLLLLFLWYMQAVLLPFIAGAVLAYFLDPICSYLTRLGLPRVWAAMLIIVSALVALVLMLVLVAPVIGNQAGKLIAAVPSLSQQLVQLATNAAPDWLKNLVADNGGDMQASITDYAGRAAVWVAGFLGTVWSGSKAVLNLFSLALITPVVAFYLLADWDSIIETVDRWLPMQHRQDIRALARDINSALAGYIRGQGTVCLILAAFYAIGFSVVGLKSGFAIGLVTGLLAFIPFFGALLGGGTALIVGLLQFWPNESYLLGVVAVLAVGQFVEGNFLSPRLVGGSIGLHPVWMMLALLGFASVFGILGLILAVPLAATTGVLVRHGLARYLASDIYLGPGGHGG